VVDLIDNATNLENDPLHFVEKFDLKVENFKKYLNELRDFPWEIFDMLRLLWLSTTVPKFTNFHQGINFVQRFPFLDLKMICNDFFGC